MKKLLSTIALLSTIPAVNAAQYDVFIDFGSKVQNNVATISHALQGVGINSLYNEGYVVHMTLYLTEYQKDALPKIKKVVDNIATQFSPFKVQFTGLHATPGYWLMMDAQKSPELQKLSDSVVKQLVDIRDKNAEIPAWAKNIPAKAASFKKYGSPNVFANFDPHITLTTPANKIDLSQFFRNYPFTSFKGEIKGIGITEANDLGQSKTVIYYKALK